ncbi:hypothetical protein [Aeromicrobium sp. NPDC092404]|uniref:hypothetical protein n=1 Tax=Aeromicrobium sp. NPDC092404 TaxID=3154976 RepID=UPI00343E9D37
MADPDAQDAAARARADSLNVSIAEIRKIANSTFGDLQDQTRTKAQQFSSADVDGSAFSTYPVAQSLGQQHQAAVAVFTQTMDGVLRDLERFQGALLDSAKEYENTDDAAAAALAAVDNKFSDRDTLDTTNSWNSARHEQGDSLKTPESDQPTTAAEPVDLAAPDSSGPAVDNPGEDPTFK